jgi:hypothetical protein
MTLWASGVDDFRERAVRPARFVELGPPGRQGGSWPAGSGMRADRDHEPVRRLEDPRAVDVGGDGHRPGVAAARGFPSIIQRSVFRNTQMVTVGSSAAGAY